MKGFEPYLGLLESIVDELAKPTHYIDASERVHAALNGQPAIELRRLIPLTDIREAGAFFTGSRLAKAALRLFVDTLDDNSVILDPACGAGDLLIACAARLNKGRDIAHTLEIWGSRLTGRDLYPEFIYATKLRLILTAMRGGMPLGDWKSSMIHEGLLGVEQRCGLSDTEAFGKATHIIVNPPFTRVDAPKECQWANGKVNAAALFLEACVSHARSGTRIVAILPDVLRSGSRYRKWRQIIGTKALIRTLELHGQFDKWADIDVFIIELEVTENDHCQASWWEQTYASNAACIKDYCDVSVGPVVNYRDPHRGPWYPFVQSRNLPAWQTLNQISTTRRFEGRVLRPPFVVVRRTSRKGDKHRAVGTVIAGKEPIAVENHLLVLQPKDNTVEACQQIQSVLKRVETTHWLDQRIRCRHLTVSSVEELPWWSK